MAEMLQSRVRKVPCIDIPSPAMDETHTFEETHMVVINVRLEPYIKVGVLINNYIVGT